MRSIRRQGVPATKRGKPNPEYLRSTVDGLPTAERLAKAHSHFTIGDDKQGTRIYHFHDSPLDRLYSRLTRQASRATEEQLRTEYIALQRYKHCWHHAGLESSLASMTLDRIFAADPGSMSGMAKTERQAHHRQQYRAARELLGHKPGIVVDNVVCAEWPLHIAGHSIGYDSPYRARLAATEILRDAGYRLARLWGIG